MWPHDWREAKRRDASGGSVERAVGRVLQVHEHPAVLRRRPHGGGFVGDRLATPTAAIDLEARAQDHVLERRGSAGSHEDRFGRLLREQLGLLGVGSRVGFPNSDVDDEVGVEIFDDARGAHDITGLHEVEATAIEAASGRVDIDAHDRGDPRLVLELTRHKRPELTAHASDQDPQTGVGGHGVNLVVCSAKEHDPAGQRSS